MFTRASRLPDSIIIVGLHPAVNRLCVEGRCGSWTPPRLDGGKAPSAHNRHHTSRVTIQSRHATEDSRRITFGSPDVLTDLRTDFRVRLYFLRRASSTRLVGSNRRRGTGA